MSSGLRIFGFFFLGEDDFSESDVEEENSWESWEEEKISVLKESVENRELSDELLLCCESDEEEDALIYLIVSDFFNSFFKPSKSFLVSFSAVFLGPDPITC